MEPPDFLQERVKEMEFPDRGLVGDTALRVDGSYNLGANVLDLIGGHARQFEERMCSKDPAAMLVRFCAQLLR